MTQPLLPHPAQASQGATTVLDLVEPADVVNFDRLQKRYEQEKAVYLQQQKAIVKVQQFVEGSMSANMLAYVQMEPTIKHILRALHRFLQPTNTARMNEVAAAYYKALRSTSRIGWEKWLENYELAFI